MSTDYPFDVTRAKRALGRADPELGAFIRRAGPFALPIVPFSSPFEYLLKAIVYQQLSTKAAATIHGRIKDLFDRRRPTAKGLLKLDDATLRGAGVSRNKLLSLRDLAERTKARRIPGRSRLFEMGDEAIMEQLLEIRGVGPWTVQMLLIFGLGRPDVLPATDLGVQHGFRIIYGHDGMPSPEAIIDHGERWRPYRSIASWYMYRAVHLERGEG